MSCSLGCTIIELSLKVDYYQGAENYNILQVIQFSTHISDKSCLIFKSLLISIRTTADLHTKSSTTSISTLSPSLLRLATRKVWSLAGPVSFESKSLR